MMARKVLTLDKPCKDHGFKGSVDGYAGVRRAESDRKPDGRSRKPKVLMHRWVFFMEHGYYPPVVMHKCDNPRCIEITHLAPGDWDMNNKDRAAKGRSTKHLHAKRKLSDDEVREIRARYVGRGVRDNVNGVSALAREFGVDSNVIYQIADGRTYTDVA
jgi:hypothetical protein